MQSSSLTNKLALDHLFHLTVEIVFPYNCLQFYFEKSLLSGAPQFCFSYHSSMVSTSLPIVFPDSKSLCALATCFRGYGVTLLILRVPCFTQYRSCAMLSSKISRRSKRKLRLNAMILLFSEVI